MNETAKRIGFTDGDCRILFFVPDGGNIVLTHSDGARLVCPCKYLDEAHVQVGNEAFPICGFAEKMERSGTAYAPEHPPRLPDMCFSTLPPTGKLIIIKKGGTAYGRCGLSTPDGTQNRILADRMNIRAGITRQQEAAMVGGLIFGWADPAAKTSNCGMRGDPISPKGMK